jgi:hypothetical protein
MVLVATSPARAQVQPPAGAEAPAAKPAEAAIDPKAEAEKKVGEAELGYEAGDYRGSLVKLTEARDLYASPVLHFNFGLSYRGLERDREALDAFQRFVRETSADDPTLVVRRREAAWHIEALQGRLQRAVAGAAPASARPAPAVVVATAPAPASAPARFYRRWWFWTAVGVLAAGAAGTAVLWQRSPPGPCAGVTCSLGDFRLP